MSTVTITCDCGEKSHPTGSSADVRAVVAEKLEALTPAKRRERIHGFVTLAHHPVLSGAPQILRDGPWPV